MNAISLYPTPTGQLGMVALLCTIPLPYPSYPPSNWAFHATVPLAIANLFKRWLVDGRASTSDGKLDIGSWLKHGLVTQLTQKDNLVWFWEHERQLNLFNLYASTLPGRLETNPRCVSIASTNHLHIVYRHNYLEYRSI